jgi:hypothetical protein
MSFMDPIGFSSYSAYPVAPASVMPPAVESQYFPMYGGGSPYGQFGGSPYGQPGGFPSFSQQYPPCPPMQQPGGDPSGGMSGMLGMLMNLFMSLLGNQGNSSIPPDGGDYPTEDPGNIPPEGETPVDTREQDIQGLNPDSNTDALQILSAYGSDLGAKNGKLDTKALKKVANLDVPDVVKKAAKNLLDNPELYNLLCLKSHNKPSEGFRLTTLDDTWDGKVDIDSLESFSSAKDAVSKLKSSGKLAAIAALSGGTTDISHDDLEKVALGTAGSQFKDPELQAAALKLLSDSDSWNSLDTINKDDASKFDQTADNSFDQAAIDKWLSVN